MKRRWGRSAASAVARRVARQGTDRGDRALLRVIDDGFRATRERSGDRLACAPGCYECCVGPFPVTRLDVRRLRDGLEKLRSGDRARAEAIGARAGKAVAALSVDYPGDAGTGRLTGDVATLDAFFARHAALACPALDPVTGRCELYDARPVSCRTYGPPLRFGDEKAAPCRLCFDGAASETVEACRFEPDPDGIEQALLRKLGAGDDDWETLIAFALSPGD